jgi:hypothetical protein
LTIVGFGGKQLRSKPVTAATMAGKKALTAKLEAPNSTDIGQLLGLGGGGSAPGSGKVRGHGFVWYDVSRLQAYRAGWKFIPRLIGFSIPIRAGLEGSDRRLPVLLLGKPLKPRV